jgi:hypothetical protein
VEWTTFNKMKTHHEMDNDERTVYNNI